LKENTNSDQAIIDGKKIENLAYYNNIDKYTEIKSALGLESNRVDYNFNILITIYNEDGSIENEWFFGAIDNDSHAKASITRQVLVYNQPTAEKIIGPTESSSYWAIASHPYYKQAEVTISLFIGGTPPDSNP